MPEALISRITSRGPGVGSGNSLSSSLRSPRNTTPFMVLRRCAVFGEARSDAPAALDRPAPKQSTTRTAARQRPRPDAEIGDGKVSFLNPPLASHHSITSSARASTLAGISRPSALAVLRLITSSYLVDACTEVIAWLLELEDAVDVRRPRVRAAAPANSIVQQTAHP